MILAEKIIKLRKQKGWSQEELALQMNVSRQSVSKWESMSSLPDLDKIIKLSDLFGVSTDYLLKDDMEEEPGYENSGVVEPVSVEEKGVEVTLEEATTYMELVEKAAKKIAAGVAMCILSPVFLIVFTTYADVGRIAVKPEAAGAVGVAVLLVMVAIAVMIFISTGIKLDKYEYLEKEILNLQYGIAGITQSRKEVHEPVYKKSISIGVALCIVCTVPLIVAGGFEFADEVYSGLVAVLLICIACAVFLFVNAGMIRDSYQKLLEEGDYTVEKKMKAKRNNNISIIYWGVITAIFLAYSFVTMDWGRSWIIWPVAAVLFGAVCAVADVIRKKQ